MCTPQKIKEIEKKKLFSYKNGNGRSACVKFTFHQNREGSPDIDAIDLKKSLESRSYVKFEIFQLESTSEGQPHYQGFIQFNRKFTIWKSTLVKDFPGNAHFCPEFSTKEDIEHSIEYCSKTHDKKSGRYCLVRRDGFDSESELLVSDFENGEKFKKNPESLSDDIRLGILSKLGSPGTFGEPNKDGRPSKENDVVEKKDSRSIDQIRLHEMNLINNLVRKGKTREEVENAVRKEFSSDSYLYNNTIISSLIDDAIMKNSLGVRIRTEIEFGFGNFGSGKSTFLEFLYPESNPDFYGKKSSHKNGKKIWYNKKKALRAKVLILEETRLGFPKNHEIITLVDGGELEAKFGFFFKRFEKVIFVSDQDPFKVYYPLSLDSRYELLRRFTKVFYVMKNKSLLDLIKSEFGDSLLPSEFSVKYKPHVFDETEFFRSRLLDLESKVYTPEIDVIKCVEKYRLVQSTNPDSPILMDLRLDVLKGLKEAEVSKKRLLVLEQKYSDNAAYWRAEEHRNKLIMEGIKVPDFPLVPTDSRFIVPVKDFSLKGIIEDSIVGKYLQIEPQLASEFMSPSSLIGSCSKHLYPISNCFDCEASLFSSQNSESVFS